MKQYRYEYTQSRISSGIIRHKILSDFEIKTD